MAMFIKVLGVFLLMLVSVVAQAKALECIGMEAGGYTVHAIIDMQTKTVNVDSRIYRIVGPTNNGKGFVTERFRNNDGIYAYNSFYPINDYSVGVLQFNVKTGQVLSRATLSCH